MAWSSLISLEQDCANTNHINLNLNVHHAKSFTWFSVSLIFIPLTFFISVSYLFFFFFPLNMFSVSSGIQVLVQSIKSTGKFNFIFYFWIIFLRIFCLCCISKTTYWLDFVLHVAKSAFYICCIINRYTACE